ncbi:hypothetical protein INR49_027736 [Caranx melampygus]|nr:hypothetical protein INR49_027736 [Caranx melampygus]
MTQESLDNDPDLETLWVSEIPANARNWSVRPTQGFQRIFVPFNHKTHVTSIEDGESLHVLLSPALFDGKSLGPAH